LLAVGRAEVVRLAALLALGRCRLGINIHSANWVFRHLAHLPSSME
jgi:hypothetical protein